MSVLALQGDALKRPKNLDHSKIKLTHHCAKRANERFSQIKQIQAYVMNAVKNGKYLGIKYDEEVKNKAHQFYYEDIMVILGINLVDVLTVYKINPKEAVKIPVLRNDEFTEKLIHFIDKESRIAHRMTDRLEKLHNKYKLEADLEIAQLKIRIHKTRSKAVKKEAEDRIEQLMLNIQASHDKVQQAKEKQSRIVKTSGLLKRSFEEVNK